MKRKKAVARAKTKKQSIKRHPAAKTKTKLIRKSDQTDQPDCPYRAGTLYGTLFTEANKDYVLKDELIRKVAGLTKKSEKVVGFAYQVLKSPKHRSNKGRSTVIEENGKIKLIAVRTTH